MPARRSPWMNSADGELDDLRDLARTFCEKEIKPHAETFIENKQVDRELWNRAGELGLLCLSIPEEYGGGGGTFAHEAVVIEEQAYVGDSSWGASLHSGIVAHYILNYGSEEQKQEWLPKLASGEAVGAIAMTEPGTGSDLQSVKTKAISRGRRVRHQRLEDLHHQRRPGRRRDHRREDQPGGGRLRHLADPRADAARRASPAAGCSTRSA